ncbi:MAG: hypothetical protein KTR32_22045 [Granulosicoccus sp.]|nr:hypothetical protein [Granulosicoccus sp.]
MKVTRRFILKLSSVAAGMGLVGYRASAAAINTDHAAGVKVAASATSATRLPEGTLIISRNSSGIGARLMVVNNCDETLTLREVVPYMAQVDGKLFDLNTELRKQPLVVPANSVRSCALEQLQDWQVHNIEQVQDVRRARLDFRAVASVQRENEPHKAQHAQFRLVA